MKGKILYVNPDAEYTFKGALKGEDGTKYFFSSANWLDKTLAETDISVDMEVEFELKAPNIKGRVFPKNIRVPGTAVTFARARTVMHSRGDFQALVFVQKEVLFPVLEALVGGFDPEKIGNANHMYREIAEYYNNLSDGDFFEKGTGDNAILLIPTGFRSTEGHEVQLYCTKNTNGEKSAWFCKKLCCDGRVYGDSVFSIVNANWYDVRNKIKDLAGDAVESDAQTVIQNIEKRCMDFESAMVCLQNGLETDFDLADTLYIPTGYYEAGGKEIYLGCRRQFGGARGAGWYVKFATYENAPLTLWGKKQWLEMWGGRLDVKRFQNLADQTLPEKWDFGSRSDFGILRNYLFYTFAHQWMQNKVTFSADGKYAAFNTGLPSGYTFDYLYAVYEKLPEPAEGSYHPLHYYQQYTFRSFTRTGLGGDGKILATNFRPLPTPPQYFKDRSSTVWELDFNASNQVELPSYDDEHILIQRCERIPLEFYYACARMSPTMKAILDSSDANGEKCRRIKEFFKPVLEKTGYQAEVAEAYDTLADELRKVIRKAVQKLSWNWRGVVPCYNPSLAQPCFLLPVSFCDSNKPDRALIATVERPEGESPVYTIHTVIPLNWAYLNARLVCRPESEWLGTEVINMGADDDDDETEEI